MLGSEEEPILLPLGNPVSINVPSDLEKKFEALPDRIGHARARVWTVEEDQLILKFWSSKRHEDIARAIGVSVSTLQSHYNLLVQSKST